jgi:hypothetical protein
MMASRVVVRGIVGIALQVALVGLVLAGGVLPASAAKPSHGGGGGGGGGGGSTSTPTGNDVSYPQCGSSLPSAPAFAIVGVNDGLANDLNPCLGPSSSYPSYSQSELYWAVVSSLGGTSQPKASLYVNTADPGNSYNGAPVADWPTSGGGGNYGSCTTTTVTLSSGSYTLGANSDACAWQYGYDKASQDTSLLQSAAEAIDGQQSTVVVPGAPGSYPWWLDVETANTWQADTSMNLADLQGMVAALQSAGVAVIGAYSTPSQWNTITGGTTSSAAGSLYQIPEWLAGARDFSEAESNCTQSSFTGGTVAMTQWFGHPIDGDYAC